MKYAGILPILTILIINTAMAKTYSCIDLDKKVNLKAVQLSENSGRLQVLLPIPKEEECLVSDFTNGSEVVKGFICGGDNNELPDLFMVNEKSKRGMLEMNNHPHYDLECEILN